MGSAFLVGFFGHLVVTDSRERAVREVGVIDKNGQRRSEVGR